MLVGCASDVSDATVDGIVETEGESAEAITRASRALLGSYHFVDSGFAPASGTLLGLVLTDKPVGTTGRTEFFADLDTGIRCITAPCPSTRRLTGSFTATSRTLSLHVNPAPNVRLARPEVLTYAYTKTRNLLTVTLTSNGLGRGETQQLKPEVSYCATPVDCGNQNLITPRCIGAFSCTDDNACAFHCGFLPEEDCRWLPESACDANPQCEAVHGPSHCSPDGTRCTRDFVFKQCQAKAPEGCAGLDASACSANDACQTTFKPFPCPPGQMCPAVMVFDKCVDKPVKPACEGRDEASCTADDGCEARLKNFPCPPGRLCPAVMVFDRCVTSTN
ncbi:MAG: hypothetical protein U0169_14675 [Polyangiaceae bacterium]